ncbi:MAG: hypothetical protein APR55_05010 [Methanolinea sp. SDB]|nr:MAG: hypothetical protein APR55_05010 [Methanolinea sp. SDB]
MKRWMGLEIRKINKAVVAERKTLSALLSEESPSSRTKGGEEYRFDRDVLVRMGEILPKDIKDRLRLPILFYFDSTVADSCFLADETAARALQELGEISRLRSVTGEKVWVGKPIVFAIAAKYRKAVQMVIR